MGVGLIISTVEPLTLNRYTWLKPLPDGGREWYELLDGGWVLVNTEPAPATADHTHEEFGDISFTGTIKVKDDAGIAGEFDSKTHILKKLKVVSGVITELEVEEL